MFPHFILDARLLLMLQKKKKKKKIVKCFGRPSRENEMSKMSVSTGCLWGCDWGGCDMDQHQMCRTIPVPLSHERVH